MKKIICVTGPTGTGKTAYSLQLAKEHNCSIINMDSVQIYKGMDVGSNKIKNEEMQGINHHLLSYVGPDEEYTVADFQTAARGKIEALLEVDDAVILVGGSGLYFNAVLFEYSFANYQKSDFEYLDKMSKEELLVELKKIDPNFEKIDLNNPIRMINAIKYYLVNNESITENKTLEIFSKFQKYDIINYYVDIEDNDVLKQLIQKRTRQMIRSGLISEVMRLLENGVKATNKSQQSIGYKQVHQYLEANDKDLKFLNEEIALRTMQYVKKQRKWFKIKFNPFIKTVQVEKKENNEE
jgi:tRNA dimethylallyltransferase